MLHADSGASRRDYQKIVEVTLDDGTILHKTEDKKIGHQALLKGVSGIKLSRAAWFSGVENLSLLLW
jgi:hypothetical protein